LDGAFVGAGLPVGLRAADLTTLVLAGAFAAGVTAATSFLGGALVLSDLAVSLRAADLATLALLAGAFAARARVAAIVLTDFFAANLFIVFFAAATFFVFFVFFAIFVFPIVAADFPNHTGLA
jgi:hypothetical protein